MTAGHWSEGYATGASYSHHYFDDLNPLHAAFVLLLEGLDGPPPGPCCELGFGQGVSLAMHAAADPARRWWGNDFMPEHAAHAQSLVQAAGTDAVVSDQSFEEFFARGDLPQFAFVGLHGVWSWVSAANRARIAQFLRRHLLPGAVVYVGYNTSAGWSAAQPLRELMLQHTRLASPAGRADLARTQEALAFVRQVLALKPAVLTATPGLEQAFAELATKTPAYVLHEFLNDSWQPMSFAEISAELLPAKLAFAASSDLHFRHHDIHFTRPQQDELARIEAGVLRETTRDVLLGRRFRREYWVRGARPLSRAEVAQRLRELRVVAAMPLQHVPGRVEGTVGTAVPAAERVAALFEWVEGAGGVVEVGLLLDNAQQRGWNPNELLELLATLVGMRAFYPAAPEAQAQGARPSALRLNAYLSAPHASRTELLHLASPVTGGGVAAPLALQMMLAARRQAPENPQAWAGQVWDAMQAEGQQMMKGQQRVTDRTTALATLQPLVRQMQEQSLPLLRRLGVVD